MKHTQYSSRRWKSKHSGQLESPNFEDEQQKNTELKEGRGLGLVSLADAEREQKSTPFPSGSDLGHHDSSQSKPSSSLLLSGNRFPVLGGYPYSTHPNRPYHSYSRIQHSGLDRNLARFVANKRITRYIFILYSTAYPQIISDASYRNYLEVLTYNNIPPTPLPRIQVQRERKTPSRCI